MMYELLVPLSDDVVDYIDGLPSQTLGKKVTYYREKEFFDYDKYQIAIIGIGDNRGAGQEDLTVVDVSKIRKALYALYPGNWGLRIIDFGDILPGDTIEDTHFVVKSIVSDLIKNNVLPIVIGGSQDLTYGMYRAYDDLNKLVNIVTIDSKLDVAKGANLSVESFLSRIILEEPVNLFNYANLGYQTFYNSQEEIDLIDSLYFEAYRVGEVSANLKIAEPVLRDADIVSIDMGVVKSGDSGNHITFNPNGFDGKEICALGRYAGLSDRVSTFGIFNYNNTKNEALLIAQIIWYFIEGYNYRTGEYPFERRANYLKFIVPIEGYEDLIFYKSDISGRWWVENGIVEFENSKGISLMPCNEEEYLMATKQEIPERWWKALKRSML
ncbi:MULTISPECIES: formimidoylglutamase [Myroides]|uniref:formimidoylglutamase n=1 Tax=Myroides TaxID=76831 RepID=UPI001320E542|nr:MULTISPECIES: formimidoylglutamase [Myroides]MVX36260.1 arginase [Myroides sp. LoEW2-1]UVD80717.1 formimidoylglutamase [Myroides albus]